jgi:hypothetical protein
MSDLEKALLQELHERAEQRRQEGIERMKNRIID